MGTCSLCGHQGSTSQARSGRELCADPRACLDRWKATPFAQARQGTDLSTKQFPDEGD